MDNRKFYTCSFFGHRNVNVSEQLENNIMNLVEYLIINNNCKYFCFGSKSKFDNLCFDIVTKLKKQYSYIVRINYRAENEDYFTDDYKNFLLKIYDEIYFNDNLRKLGKLKYVVRNQAMIDDSDYCIFYYDENYKPPMRKKSKRDLFEYQPKSGTKLAYDYAVNKHKKIINLLNLKD